MDCAKLFNDLETKNQLELEEAKKKLIDQFNATKDPWLVQGVMDYYAQRQSVRIVEVLVKVQAPHDKYIFDRLSDWMRANHKIPALSLLGHIIMRHPTWLYRVATHSLMKDILKMLKTEREIIPIMSGLLCLITLLPIVPNLMKEYLSDLFEIFSYLASWNSPKCPRKIADDQICHLQIGIYIFFQRLYGMFPCNFVHYLKIEYTNNANNPEKMAVFIHTIFPLLESVRMHPMLFTDTTDSELQRKRWRNMEAHDVIADCAKYAIDSSSSGDNSYRHQCEDDVKNTITTTTWELTTLNRLEVKSVSSQSNSGRFDSFWTPSKMVFTTPPPAILQQSSSSSNVGTSGYGIMSSTPSNIPVVANQFLGAAIGGGASPPEAAIEATPETTPMKDSRLPPQSSNTVRAITLSGSQPSSPLKKEVTAFRYTQERPWPRYIPTPQQSSEVPGSVISPLPVQTEAIPVRKSDQDQDSQKLMAPEPSQHELSHSPCSVGGLHMPDPTSIQEFKQLGAPATIKPTEEEKMHLDGEGACGQDGAAYHDLMVNLSGEFNQSQQKKPSTTDPDLERYKIHNPDYILNKWIQSGVAKRNALNAKNAEETYRSQIQLLICQLQLERHQREVHAERNRRLFGRSKEFRFLAQNNETLQMQVNELMDEVSGLKGQLIQSQEKFTFDRKELTEELSNWKKMFKGDKEEIKQLKLQLDQTQTKLAEEERQNRVNRLEIDRVSGQLFDLQNEKSSLSNQASKASYYHDQLTQLQSEVILMGELHKQWRDRLCDVEFLQDREQENNDLKLHYEDELDKYKLDLDKKNILLETSLAKISDLEQTLQKRESSFTDQKRLLKTVKEEFEEKFEALESKYAAQKSIILKMEEHLLELYKNPGNCLSSDSNKIDMIGSIDHTSPLSLSLTSSDGLSTSLKSTTELKALPALVPGSSSMTSSTSGGNIMTTSVSSTTLKSTAEYASNPAHLKSNPPLQRQDTFDDSSGSPSTTKAKK